MWGRKGRPGKKGHTMTKITIATGDTYPARAQLKAAGFAWDAVRKTWTITTDQFDRAEWARVNESATYSRANLTACKGVTFADVLEG